MIRPKEVSIADMACMKCIYGYYFGTCNANFDKESYEKMLRTHKCPFYRQGHEEYNKLIRRIQEAELYYPICDLAPLYEMPKEFYDKYTLKEDTMTRDLKSTIDKLYKEKKSKPVIVIDSISS